MVTTDAVKTATAMQTTGATPPDVAAANSEIAPMSKKKKQQPRYVIVPGHTGIFQYHHADGVTISYGWRGIIHNGKPFEYRFGYDTMEKAIRARDASTLRFIEMLKSENLPQFNSRLWNLEAKETIRRAASGDEYEIPAGTHAEIETQRLALLRFARKNNRSVNIQFWKDNFLVEVL